MMKQEIKNWTVLSSEYIAREPWFTVRKEKVCLPNGSVIPSYYVLEYPAWINVIAITKEGMMIMERQYRHGLARVDYELCAGVVDPTDATPLEAARRELLEETGYGNGTWKLLMVTSVNPGTHTNFTYCFLATGVEKVTERHLEQTEDIAVELLSKDEVRKLLEADRIVQALHVAPLWRYFAEEYAGV
ncbi:MAG: NUDIX hydrolase [Odoribacter sp.]|nr:NUDIX hydrolase [Odoribacter sp.]